MQQKNDPLACLCKMEVSNFLVSSSGEMKQLNSSRQQKHVGIFISESDSPFSSIRKVLRYFYIHLQVIHQYIHSHRNSVYKIQTHTYIHTYIQICPPTVNFRHFLHPVHKVCGKYMAVSLCFWRSLRQTPSVKKLWLLGEKKSRWSGKGSKFRAETQPLCWIKPWWFILTDYQSVTSYTSTSLYHCVFLSLKCWRSKLCQFSSTT